MMISDDSGRTSAHQEDAVAYLQAMASGRRAQPNHAGLLGARIAAAATGEITLLWTPPEQLLNPAGTVHGGFIAGVLDMAAGLAAASAREVFTHHITLEMHIDFLASVPAGASCQVIGRVVRAGKSSSLADAKVSLAGQMLARGRGTFLPNRRWETAHNVSQREEQC